MRVIKGLIGIILLGVFLRGGLYVAATQDTLAQRDNIQQDELIAILEDGEHEIKLIDVREPMEYSAGHIPSAVLIPLGELMTSSKLETYELDDIIVVVCRSGNRSAQAQHILRELGYKQVINLQGGMLAWTGAVVKE